MFERANEATVEVNGVPTTCVVDTGVTVTIITADFCEKQGLEIHSIDGLISCISYRRHYNTLPGLHSCYFGISTYPKLL